MMASRKISQLNKPVDTAKKLPTIIPEIDKGKVLNLAAFI